MPQPKEKHRNEVFEAVAEAWRPGIPTSELTKTEAGCVGRCAAELTAVGATPETIALARRKWDDSEKWRWLTFTPDALKKHYGELTAHARPRTREDPGITETRRTLKREADAGAPEMYERYCAAHGYGDD